MKAIKVVAPPKCGGVARAFFARSKLLAMACTEFPMQIRWLYRITYLYLLLPFILFCLGWLRLFIALPIAVLMFWALWRLWSQDSGDSAPEQKSLGFLLPAIFIAGLWVLLSGVGGYAFQNWDHNWRNAVLRDLVHYDWPVVYSAPERGPIKMLVYYAGYWLPAALAGKLFGWKFANFILFAWTWLGVFLVTLHLSLKLKTSATKAILLLILFSGMDALGVLLLAEDYPALWPPIQHLEIWGDSLQYSSFTTQLFWVFNQAVPAWLCMALIWDDVAAGSREDIKLFIWSLCLFSAPLVSIGLLPYLLIGWVQQMRVGFNSFLKGLRPGLLLAGAVIFVISYLFFSSNAAAQERGFQSPALKDVVAFFLLEGGILWLLLALHFRRDPRWMATGILLFAIPFAQLGSGRDFVMRASIAPLFYLMMMTGEILFQSAPRVLRIAFYVLLLLGALTPLYEINRSVYRTYEYYFLLDESQRIPLPSEPSTHLEQGGAPEAEHPGALAADDIQTLALMDDKLTKNFIANVRQSLYYRYLAPQ